MCIIQLQNHIMICQKPILINTMTYIRSYDPCFENQKSTDKEELADQKKSADLSDMPPPESDEEKKNKKDQKF